MSKSSNGCTSLIQVLSDGAITFDRPVRLSRAVDFPLEGKLQNLQIISLFLTNHDPRSVGLVRYRTYSGAAFSRDVQTVSRFLRNKGFSEGFAGNWMLVAEWRDVSAYPAMGEDDEVSILHGKAGRGRKGREGKKMDHDKDVKGCEKGRGKCDFLLTLQTTVSTCRQIPIKLSSFLMAVRHTLSSPITARS